MTSASPTVWPHCDVPAPRGTMAALASASATAITLRFTFFAVQMAIGAVAYRFTRARQMVRQYPWLYRRKGLLDWEERH